jgi:uncharacterized alkaline shock family protein YloU
VTAAPPAAPDPTVSLDPSAATAPTRDLTRPGVGLVTSRGETIIAPLVVEKIAGRAASEVDGVGGVVQTGLSRLLPWSVGGTPAHAQAAVGDGKVQLDMTVNVLYPRPVAMVTNAVRSQVSRRLAELCGLEATRIDISVPALVTPPPGVRRRVE